MDGPSYRDARTNLTRPIGQRCVLSVLRYAFCDGGSGGVGGGGGGGRGGVGSDCGSGISQVDSQFIDSSISGKNEKAFRTYLRTDLPTDLPTDGQTDGRTDGRTLL